MTIGLRLTGLLLLRDKDTEGWISFRFQVKLFHLQWLMVTINFFCSSHLYPSENSHIRKIAL